MIRFFDAVILAHTKLRTHKVRTGITIGIAGILFGLILGATFIVQGVLDSVVRFGKEGLGDRAIVTAMHFEKAFPLYNHLEDQGFISEVERAHAAYVTHKKTVAKKHAVPYDPESEDPSPVSINKQTKKKFISDQDIGSVFVQEAGAARKAKTSTPFDIQTKMAPYNSATLLGVSTRIAVHDGSFLYMKDGKEFSNETEKKNADEVYGAQGGGEQGLITTAQSVVQPFISKQAIFDPKKGEVPVVIPFRDAEKLLGLEKLKGEASTEDKYQRLEEVRRRINDIDAAFCYRNGPSQQVLEQARLQEVEMKRSSGDASYIPPALQYTVPPEDSCGAVTIARDTRTQSAKQLAERRIAYEKELGVYAGEPQQYRVPLRVVGISGDVPEVTSMIDIAGLAQSLLGSWLNYGNWTIPEGMLYQIPPEVRPAVVFNALTVDQKKSVIQGGMTEYLIEFGEKDQARDFLKKNGAYGTSELRQDELLSGPYGSGVLVIEDMKQYVSQGVLWALLVVGGVAVIILGSVIGRAVAEGRRESAIFRAIGARRADIGSIYGVYAFLLSVRVVVFALILGLALALGVEWWLSEDATLAARYTYAATDTAASFHFFSPFSVLVPCVLGAIVLFGMVASIVPVILSARRNPMRDMRDDT